VDRIRSLVSRGVPAATGVLPVGDSWACTNPSLGRGVTFGLMQAVIIAEAVAEHLKHPLALSLAYDRLTRERLVPWYRHTTDLDNQRAAEITAVIEGRPPQPAEEPAEESAAAVMRDLLTGMTRDADVFRAYQEMMLMLAPPQEVLARLGLAEKIAEAARAGEPWAVPGPSRAEVLKMLS
jgi:2-polyprenyl-6-methoxyphenol hydroxylase-like FAD-dependent oxidoreductase